MPDPLVTPEEVAEYAKSFRYCAHLDEVSICLLDAGHEGPHSRCRFDGDFVGSFMGNPLGFDNRPLQHIDGSPDA